MPATVEKTVEQNLDMRRLSEGEMQRRMALAVLSGKLIDGRARFAGNAATRYQEMSS